MPFPSQPNRSTIFLNQVSPPTSTPTGRKGPRPLNSNPPNRHRREFGAEGLVDSWERRGVGPRGQGARGYEVTSGLSAQGIGGSAVRGAEGFRAADGYREGYVPLAWASNSMHY
mmetsp:Transcript_6520/g.10332  ORF Transcript_6520/g.10332 Transcript_6520/m.10332 type:complete len:114 (-) Transcript_6520:78-419(-)